MSVLLFSYGTLQQAGVQMETFNRLLSGAADALPSYKRAMVRITDPEVIAASGSDQHPIVSASADPKDEVSGTVFEITEAELAAADAYEVSDYRRISVRLKSGRTAWVYVRA
jgi:gamma-glutamylcyclotransferase (GGCT)/AIG2-like uncharacterized protein YtfP